MSSTTHTTSPDSSDRAHATRRPFEVYLVIAVNVVFGALSLIAAAVTLATGTPVPSRPGWDSYSRGLRCSPPSRSCSAASSC